MPRIFCTFCSTLAERFPRFFSAAWFLLAASVLIIPAIIVLIPTSLYLSNSIKPSTGYLLWIGILPLITIVFTAGIIGPRILALPASKTHLAGIYGTLLAIAAFAIWAIPLEVFPGSDRLNNAAGNSSDIPGAAVVVAYLVGCT